jgi:Xaa-Pro aminopeptidase
MFDRRDMLKAIGLAGTGGVSAGMAAAGDAQAAMTTSLTVQGAQTYPGVDGRRLVNHARAERILEEEKLDGMIALNPVNVYYLSNTLPIGVKMRWEYPAFATFARRSTQPVFLVTTTAMMWEIKNGEREVPEVICYGGAQNWRDYVNASAAQMKIEPQGIARAFPVKEGAVLTEREKRWLESHATHYADVAPTPAWALARALKESGLTRGRIAVDDMRIKYLLEEIGQADDITFIPGDRVFRAIRMVKSDAEIALMRVAGRNNGDAAMAAMKALTPGMRYEDVERLFRAELAARGNDLTFLVCGTTLGGPPDGELRAGRPFLMDCVSRFREYHGDFARTIILGDPPKDVLARAAANKLAREAAFAEIKPGAKFSDIEAIARSVMAKNGIPEAAIVSNLHSVGLQHTDQPVRFDVPFNVRPDLVLEENMTVTLDLPYVEIGWGAGHNEDLIRITKTGYEPLNTESDPLVVVGA